MTLDPWSGAMVFAAGVLMGALLVIVSVLAGFWISARSRGDKHPIRGEHKAPEPEITQEETD